MNERYPNAPGWKARSTSKAAADDMKPKAKTIAQKVLEAVRAQPGTPEEIGKRLGFELWTIRPRFSELAGLGLICDSGERGPSRGGKLSIVWKAVDVQEVAA